MQDEIKLFLEALPPGKRVVALKLQAIIKAAYPSITETIKWKQLTYMVGKTNVAFIYTYPTVDYVNLGFLQATSLRDPNQLFIGTGKGMRHIKLKSVKEIPKEQVKAWIHEAATLSLLKK